MHLRRPPLSRTTQRIASALRGLRRGLLLLGLLLFAASAQGQGLSGGATALPFDATGGVGGTVLSPSHGVAATGGEGLDGSAQSGTTYTLQSGFQRSATGGDGTVGNSQGRRVGLPAAQNNSPFGCMIATVAHGTPLQAQLPALRGLRDRLRASGSVGAALVRGYYRVSPTVAGWLYRNESARQAAAPLVLLAASAATTATVLVDTAAALHPAAAWTALVALAGSAGLLLLTLAWRRRWLFSRAPVRAGSAEPRRAQAR